MNECRETHRDKEQGWIETFVGSRNTVVPGVLECISDFNGCS